MQASLVAESGRCSPIVMQASHSCEFSCEVQIPGVQASVAVACGLSIGGSQALERRLNSCVIQA